MAVRVLSSCAEVTAPKSPHNISNCKLIKGRVPPFLHKVVLRRANQPHNSHEDRFSMLWPSRTQSPPKSQITMVKVSGKHIWWHQICLPDTLTIVIWLLGGDCVRLGQSIEKRSSWELWGWFALLKTTLCKKGGTLPLNNDYLWSKVIKKISSKSAVILNDIFSYKAITEYST